MVGRARRLCAPNLGGAFLAVLSRLQRAVYGSRRLVHRLSTGRGRVYADASPSGVLRGGSMMIRAVTVPTIIAAAWAALFGG